MTYPAIGSIGIGPTWDDFDENATDMFAVYRADAHPDDPTRTFLQGIVCIANRYACERLAPALEAAQLTPEQRARFDAAWGIEATS